MFSARDLVESFSQYFNFLVPIFFVEGIFEMFWTQFVLFVNECMFHILFTVELRGNASGL